MWVVDHVLVEHCVRVAQDKSGQLFEVLLCLHVVLVELLARRWEKHCVDLRSRLRVLYPDVLAFESLGKHFAHLLVLSEKRRKAALAGSATAEAVHRPQNLLR